jgi:type IV pilus assembly protein PilA
MKKVQAGFTLIELMIVVAIIGILAAIAIPQYQTYIAKTQVTRAMGEAGSVKTAIEGCVLAGKTTIGVTLVTDCDPQAVGSSILTGASQVGATLPVGTGVPIVSPALLAVGTPTIVATFGNNAAAALLNPTPQTVTWARTTDGTWGCTTSANVLPKFKPTGCP